MIKFIFLFLLLYGALLVYMYTMQRKLLYFPDVDIAPPESYGLSGFSDLRVRSSDNLSVQLWYAPAAANMPTILYFHGNAAHIGNRSAIYGALSAQGFGVAALSYRGYGKSDGTPSEQGIYADARAALAFLTMEKNIPLSQIMLFGESLGTGVAIQIASESDVAAVILQAPYTSVAARAAQIYYYVPVRLLITDRFDSLSKIGRVKAPVLFFHGELDQVIPIQQGKALFDASPSLKRAYYFPQVGHTDFDPAIQTAHIIEFAKEYKIIR
ncbi:MAG: alpha/beta fold hydrolase [Rickettsiales bacterium]|nr:alpha/beta fold hydrolase [Rickettsiales bacterium]